MSGYAACALVVEEDRGQFATTIRMLGESFTPSAGKSPFSLDSYLSWMSPSFSYSYLLLADEYGATVSFHIAMFKFDIPTVFQRGRFPEDGGIDPFSG